MTNNQLKPQTLKGFRDFLPEEMRIRQYVLGVCRQVFEAFGFEPLETPALESAQVLLGKYGKEADKLLYLFKDRGQREVGLRYDLTVPTSRVLAQYSSSLTLPFKRYQIQPVWRAENPQKSRYREFWQCDIDTFGISSPLADAEIIAIIYQVLQKLGFKNFTIEINSRQVLFSLLQNLGIQDKQKQLSVLQSLDKIRKQGKQKVESELEAKGLKQDQINHLFLKLETAQPDKNLKEVFAYLANFGLNSKFYKFTPSMVRGLDYYTGPIFETIINDDLTLGSLSGGGRYDDLIKLLGGPDIPATGTTLGFERICDLLYQKELLANFKESKTRVLITIFPNLTSEAIKIAQILRENKINCFLYPEEKPLDKQLKYADRKKIPWVIIIGPEEIKKNKIGLKNLINKKQEILNLKEVIKKLTAKATS